MVKWAVKEVAQRAGISSAYELHLRAGLHPGTANQIWYGRAKRVDMDTLSKLCALFQVPVGQLLEYIADTKPRR
jgi:DNA-binding Xre family transcriptional regulator